VRKVQNARVGFQVKNNDSWELGTGNREQTLPRVVYWISFCQIPNLDALRRLYSATHYS